MFGQGGRNHQNGSQWITDSEIPLTPTFTFHSHIHFSFSHLHFFTHIFIPLSYISLLPHSLSLLAHTHTLLTSHIHSSHTHLFPAHSFSHSFRTHSLLIRTFSLYSHTFPPHLFTQPSLSFHTIFLYRYSFFLPHWYELALSHTHQVLKKLIKIGFLNEDDDEKRKKRKTAILKRPCRHKGEEERGRISEQKGKKGRRDNGRIELRKMDE